MVNPVETFHNLMVLSQPPEMIARPSGVKIAALPASRALRAFALRGP
jgi:hypothetical protein